MIFTIYNRNALREDIHSPALLALGTRPPAAFSRPGLEFVAFSPRF